LYILGTERHESRRIDNQLRGRSGRQGDPGESRFYISLEDDLIRIFAGDTLKKNMERFGMTEDEAIESPFVSKNIERAQEKVEKTHFDARKNLLEYDDVLNQQRIVVYTYRREVLEGTDNISGLIRDFIGKALQDAAARIAPKRSLTNEQIKLMFEFVSTLTGIPVSKIEQVGVNVSNTDTLTHDLNNFLLEKYQLYRGQKNRERIQEAEKWLMLETIDQSWKQHMLNLDHLKEGISLRSWGQKNPLIEYKREAFDMFTDMMQQIRADIVFHIFHLNLDMFNEHAIEERRERELEEINMIGGDETSQATQVVRNEEKIGRNEPCPCGSGKKYKKCCGS
jgi:preprotein translocase subunit SecA